MTKKECETSLSKLWDNTFGTDCITGEDLDKYVDIIDGLIQYVFNPQPYKFEDLKVGMWVYDIIWEECFEICEIFPKDNEIHVLIHQNRINVKRYEPIKFEEGRFFPVTKALEYQK